VKETTDGSTVIVDNSDPPTFMVGTVTAAGGIVAPDIWNSTNTEIQLEVNIPEDSAVTSFSYTIGNSLLFNGMNDEVIISGITDYQATDALTIEAWIKPNSWSDFDGILNYAADQGTSEAGFGFVYFATGWRFFLKTTSNSIDYINMAEVSTPSGQWTHLAATYDGQKVRIYRNGSAIDSTDAMGDIQWSGAPSDFKLGSFTKDGSTGYFDGQIDDVRIWNIVRTGVQIKGSRETTIDKNESGLVGYWQMDAGSGGTVTDSTSSANHGTINGATWVIEDSPLNFQAPVYDTGVIVGSAFQLRGRANTNDFEVFGVKDTITVDDLNAGIKTVSASSDAFEAITDFAHEETAQLSAFLFDVTGNYSSGDTSITNTVIDIITNSPTPVSISSDNTFSHLAKTGDIVTITMAYDEDVNTPAVAVDGNDADDVSDLGGEQFSSTYTLTGSESEGSLSFSINTTDYLGNPGSHLGSTDGSTVVYDKTLPTLSPVSIASNNADTTWAKANDSISVTFTSSERISADFALSFDGIDDEVKITGSGFISGNEPRSISVWADGSS
ncbi:MAG: LamG domain-containing protein, partial [Fidelibacterota bacterium]